MLNKSPRLIIESKIDDLSKEQLIQELELARSETFKYVNKFLELEEKSSFTNLLLKRLNSIKKKQELCKTLCDGFLKLTNSTACVCCIFNQDRYDVEFKKIAFGKEFDRHKKLEDFLEKTNSDCQELLATGADVKKIANYFNTISKNKLIIVPIIYNKNLLGYLVLIKDDENFYKENIHFVNIFPEHIALILENISLYQESEKSNKRKIEFLAGISHEFKTPLNSVMGFAEILKSRIKDSECSKYIHNISQSSSHLLTLIEDVIDVSKTQYNNLELNYTTIAPKELIVQILCNLDSMIREKNIDIDYTLTDVKISADIKRFRQLIYNLVSNAVKFNKIGGKINIFTYMKDNKFFFEVTDTGDGISKRDYEKIFDFFSQVNRSQLKRQLGSGVGLAICKMITDAHNGEIGFKSQIKKGSSFWFSLPVNRTEEG